MENTAGEEKAIDKDYETSIEKLKEYMEKTGKKQSVIAKELGKSEGYISSFLSGTYPTPHVLIPKIEQLLSISEKKQAAPVAPGFAMTSLSQAVINIITYCHIQGKIAIAYGDAGVGKTMAIQEYKRLNPDNTIVVEADPNFDTVSAWYRLLALEMGIGETKSKEIQLTAMRRLKNSNKVLIIDEAQLLNKKQIDAIRVFVGKCHIGAAFIGNHSIYTTMAEGAKGEFDQVSSRIGDEARVERGQIKKSDIELIFGNLGLQEETLEMLYQVSKAKRGLRGAANVYENTIITFQIKDYAEITAAQIATIAKKMHMF